jgi:Protein of unknown function (DUF1569)
MKYIKVNNTDFFDNANFQELINRLKEITLSSQRQWGIMNVAQMLHHLNVAIGSGLGYYTLKDKSTFISRGLIKIMILDVLKRFPVNAETPITLKITGDFNFDTEKKLLFEILNKGFETKTNTDWQAHTYFGKMTRKQWGKLIMIHCNHHFQQFGG